MSGIEEEWSLDNLRDDEIYAEVMTFLEVAHATMRPDDDFRAEAVYMGVVMGPATLRMIAQNSENIDIREIRYWIAAFREVGIPIREEGGYYRINDADLDRADNLWIEHFGKRFGGNLLVERNNLGEFVDARGGK